LLLLLSVALCTPGCAAPPDGTRSVDEVRQRGSLRGTDLDGAWDVPGPRRQAEALLLRRFDHLLTAVGETGLPALRRFIEREVTREHGAAVATQVLAAWDAHLAVLRGGPQAQLPNNPAPEATTRGPRRPEGVPRALLMPDEAATDTEAQALHTQRVARFGALAAERLRAEDMVRRDWARRLAEARSAMQGLDAAAREAWLAQRFQGRELLRARTLLGLPPG
jgi:hypothetical protein